MDQHSFKRNTPPVPQYPMKRPRLSLEIPHQPRRMPYRTMEAPAPYYNSPSPMDYNVLVETASTSDVSDHRNEGPSDQQTTSIYTSSSPVYPEATHYEETTTSIYTLSPVQPFSDLELTTPIYMSSSPVQPFSELEGTQRPPYTLTSPFHIQMWHPMDDQSRTPTPSHDTNDSPYYDENMYGSWTPASGDGGAPLIWASEVDVQILPSSPSCIPPTPTTIRESSPPDSDHPVCLVPVPTYDNPELESTEPRYQTRGIYGQYQSQSPYQDQEIEQEQAHKHERGHVQHQYRRPYDDQDQEYDTLLFELEIDPEIQALQTLDTNSMWRRRWVHDYGSDADDEGSLGGY